MLSLLMYFPDKQAKRIFFIHEYIHEYMWSATVAFSFYLLKNDVDHFSTWIHLF